jgi:hypothetical protein
MNEAVALILTSGAGFRGKKLGLNRMEAIQSSVVAGPDFTMLGCDRYLVIVNAKSCSP